MSDSLQPGELKDEFLMVRKFKGIVKSKKHVDFYSYKC